MCSVRCFWQCSAPCACLLGMKCASGPTMPALLVLGATWFPSSREPCASELFVWFLGLFWFFDFFFFGCGLLFFFDLFLISSWCRLCWQPMTAEKIKISKQNKKKALPKPKDLKTKPVWRAMETGSYRLGGPWNLLQSIKRSPKGHRCWLGELFSVFPTSVYILGFKFAWILSFFF